MKKSFGTYLQSLLDNSEVKNAAELARLLGVSTSYISAILKDRPGTKPPTIKRCEEISSILGLDQTQKNKLIEFAMLQRADDDIKPMIEKSFMQSQINLSENVSDYSKVPLLGSCPASPKAWMADDVETWHYFPKQIVKGRRLYLVRAKGDSMNKAGIDDGDLLIVDADKTPENNSIVIFCIDHEFTVKRYFKNGTQLTLMPDSYNNDHQLTMYDSKKNDILVRGVVDSIYMKKPR